MQTKEKKVIGILTTYIPNYSVPQKKGTLGIEHAYFALFSQYGTVVIVTPEESPGDRHIDLLVLPGGPDLSTALTTSTEFTLDNGKDNPVYTQFYKNKFYDWYRSGTPIFGICLGAQAINDRLGGTTTAHGNGHQITGLHKITSYSDKLGIGGKVGVVTDVNSRHHQFIRHHDLAECLMPVSFGGSGREGSPLISNYLLGRGLSIFSDYYVKNKHERDLSKIPKGNTHVEAFIHLTKPVGAVQWHPEDCFERGDDFTRGDLISHKIIEWLLNYKKEVKVPVPASPAESPAAAAAEQPMPENSSTLLN